MENQTSLKAMRKIIYYVATSLDGYIAGKNDDISMFEVEGEFVDQYSYYQPFQRATFFETQNFKVAL